MGHFLSHIVPLKKFKVDIWCSLWLGWLMLIIDWALVMLTGVLVSVVVFRVNDGCFSSIFVHYPCRDFSSGIVNDF